MLNAIIQIFFVKCFLNELLWDILGNVLLHILMTFFYTPWAMWHMLHVRNVLSWLLPNHLCVKGETCKNAFLDYTRAGANGPGQSLDSHSKVSPNNSKEAAMLSGSHLFYWSFIRGFSIIATLLTALLRKGNKWMWWIPATDCLHQSHISFLSKASRYIITLHCGVLLEEADPS